MGLGAALDFSQSGIDEMNPSAVFRRLAYARAHPPLPPLLEGGYGLPSLRDRCIPPLVKGGSGGVVVAHHPPRLTAFAKWGQMRTLEEAAARNQPEPKPL